ncbi:MAG: hypothetical protein GY868_04235 [Deltaproteobacteria bacterium]|nr:hypothetical protein [Deltaproteobacteria bacterium]
MKKYKFSAVGMFLCAVACCAITILTGCELPLKVTITSPQQGYAVLWGETVIFTGAAADSGGNQPSGLRLTWSSDRDGYLGSGVRFTYSVLSVGRHLITLNAVDADNATGRDQITITVEQRTGLIIRDSDFVGRDYREAQWASATVRSADGSFVTGMTVDDFILTEAIISKSDSSTIAEANIDINRFIGDEWSEGGFWEDSRGGEPIDIIVAYDTTGTMDDYIEDAKEELIALVDDLCANHVDFRMAALSFDEIGINDKFSFYGPQETDLLKEELDYWLDTGTEWWDPTLAYDAVMYSPWYGLREDARKVCLVITDIVPQTVYGTFWYPGGCTASTRSAMELFLEKTGVEIIYSQRTGYDPVDYFQYMDPHINPRAADNASGFPSLSDSTGRSLAIALDWPFSRQDFMETLGVAVPQTVSSSCYLFAWESSFDEWRDAEGDSLLNNPDEYELRLTLQTADPDNPAEQLSAACAYVIEKEWQDIDITLNVTDEEGTTIDSDLWGYVYHMLGERKIELRSQLSPQGGTILVDNLPLDSTYHLFICDSGVHRYAYHKIRAVHRGTIRATEDGQSFDIQVATADKISEFCKARGLLNDIADWQGIGDPFQDVVDDSRIWLDSLEADGVSWLDIARVKRFYVSLSGYVNLIYYSQQQAKGAIDDFSAIVQNFRDVVKQVNKIQQKTTDDWVRELASILIEIVDVLITRGELTVQKELLDEALNVLLTYAVENLTTDLREIIIEQLPSGAYTELLTTIINYLIDAAFGSESSEPDWDGVYEAIAAITLDEALDMVKRQVGSKLIDAALDKALQEAISDDQLTRTVKRLVKDIINALLSDDLQAGFKTSFESFAGGMNDYMFSHDNETIAAVVTTVYESVDDELQDAGVPIDVREFLVGMAKDLTLCAVPALRGGSVTYHLDTDAVVNILIKYGIYYVVLKDYFIDEINRGLEKALHEAENHIPEGDDRYYWNKEMESDFWDYRQLLRGVQETAWDALRTQDAISEWARQMEALCEILDAISGPLDFLAGIWPDLKDTADDVHAFIAILDGFQILPNSISFGLKVECLDTFGNLAELMSQAAFPGE